MPQLLTIGGRKRLFVDGAPFIILGLQWDCDWCYCPEIMDAFFAEGKKLNLNTVSLLLYWNEIEPEEGRYDFSMLDHRIEMARKYGLKLVLVWFGSYKNSGMTYAPDYIRRDHKKYRKVHDKDGALIPICCCPTAEATHQRDEQALIEVFKHLKAIDGEEHTVILFQMENEVGILNTNRCYCPECSQRFESGKWKETYGWKAEELFTAAMLCDYCDRLTKTVKEIYPLPIYMNAALPLEHVNSIPGGEWNPLRHGHFNGGPAGISLDIYRERAQHIDFFAPDIYQPSYRDFHKLCRQFSWDVNPLFIAECSTGFRSRVEKNIIYAIGEFGAIGIDPWSISRAFPFQMGEPLVNFTDLHHGANADELMKSYTMVRNAMYPIALTQHTDHLRAFVQEESEAGIKFPFGDVWIELTYDHPKDSARGFVIQQSKDEFILSCTGVSVQFSRAWGEAIPVKSVDIGRFEGPKWIPYYRMARENPDDTCAFNLRECMVARVKLGRRIDWEFKE